MTHLSLRTEIGEREREREIDIMGRMKVGREHTTLHAPQVLHTSYHHTTSPHNTTQRLHNTEALQTHPFTPIPETSKTP